MLNIYKKSYILNDTNVCVFLFDGGICLQEIIFLTTFIYMQDILFKHSL